MEYTEFSRSRRASVVLLTVVVGYLLGENYSSDFQYLSERATGIIIVVGFLVVVGGLDVPLVNLVGRLFRKGRVS